jgi:hypothetical protein
VPSIVTSMSIFEPQMNYYMRCTKSEKHEASVQCTSEDKRSRITVSCTNLACVLVYLKTAWQHRLVTLGLTPESTISTRSRKITSFTIESNTPTYVNFRRQQPELTHPLTSLLCTITAIARKFKEKKCHPRGKSRHLMKCNGPGN